MATPEDELYQLYMMGQITPEEYEAELAKLKASAGVEKPASPAPQPAATQQPAAPAPAAQPDAEEWYTAVNGAQQGPYNKAKVASMLKTGEIKRDTPVWKKGMGDWAKIEAVSELEDVLSSVPPPPPQATPVPASPPIEAVPIMLTEPVNAEVRYKEATELLNQLQYDKAFPLIETLANEGYARAQLDLGHLYKDGLGVAKDEVKSYEWYRKGVDWLRKAADQGDNKAQVRLGTCYYCGNGVEKDDAKAFEWYRKAAEQGYAPAQVHLGDSYRDGSGVPKDEKKAVEWYSKAADQGNNIAKKKLEKLKK
uniref:GYF domain-containing protein n=1 Tax=uncultured bacterium contig00151 TaxID=1181590 RepID=A0A806KH59_9BACT|nr:hypothetical protein [uncultured bacterium contig00151]